MANIKYYRAIASIDVPDYREKFYTFFREFDLERAMIKAIRYMADTAYECGHINEPDADAAARLGWVFRIEEVSLEEFYEATHNKGME